MLGIVLGTNGNLAGNLNPLGKIPLLKDDTERTPFGG